MFRNAGLLKAHHLTKREKDRGTNQSTHEKLNNQSENRRSLLALPHVRGENRRKGYRGESSPYPLIAEVQKFAWSYRDLSRLCCLLQVWDVYNMNWVGNVKFPRDYADNDKCESPVSERLGHSRLSSLSHCGLILASWECPRATSTSKQTKKHK